MSSKKTINIITHKNYLDRGARLKSWWKSRGWSKAEFARRMAIWPQNVNKYFLGELDPMSLAEKLIEENCDLAWIIEGKPGAQSAIRPVVAEPPAVYGKKYNDASENISAQTRERINRLSGLLEAGADKSDKDMLDLLIKTMEEKQRKKGKI
jgi:transcriptional regulator with XRE-family HTH domain